MELFINREGSTRIALIFLIVVIVGVVGYVLVAGQSEQLPKPLPQTQTSAPVANPASPQTRITILVPKDTDAYEKAMTAYVSDGGQDPSKNWPFVQKILDIPYADNVMRASAEAAAEQLIPHGGPAQASIAYFKVEGATAYVLLNIDLDGWAGVSFSLAKIHPLVEKTLLQFSQIKQVSFHFAPGDSRVGAF